MNGAMILDYVRSGNWAHPLAFAKKYYAHYPALSIPYHPPLFAVMEASFFSVLGVTVFAARLAVACCVAFSALLLYTLVLRNLQSVCIALCSTLTFCLLPGAVALSRDVMLEYPALVSTLAALLFMPDFEQEQNRWRAVVFGLIAAGSVWTKQNAIFVALIPFVCVAISRNWSVLRKPPIWISSAVLFAGVLMLLLLEKTVGLSLLNEAAVFKGEHNGWHMRNPGSEILANAVYYARGLGPEFGLILALSVGAVAAYWLLKSKSDLRKARIFISWLVSGLAVSLLARAHDLRYIFFVLPPMLVLGYLFLAEVSRRVTGRSWLFPITVCLLAIAGEAPYPAEFLSGPTQAARQIVAGDREARVLYSGLWNGSFIFALRSLDPNLQTIIFRGDEIDANNFTPQRFGRFVTEFGIQYVVVRDPEPENPLRWLADSRDPLFLLKADIPMTSSRTHMNGRLRVFQVLRPSDMPLREFTVHSHLLGENLKLSF